MLLPDLAFYTTYIWPISTVCLGLFSIGVFASSSLRRRSFRALMMVIVVSFPMLTWLFAPSPTAMTVLSISYVLFFMVIVVEVFAYLFRPSYINLDIISAAICGYLLLLEVGIFLMQALYYVVPGAFTGIDSTSFKTVYIDLVYFCSVVVTSIGFGDVLPDHHTPKLAASFLGVLGQLYLVVLMGILIGKYTAASHRR